MRELIQIPTDDDHLIYGTLDSFESKKDKLIIFCHGLSGNENEPHYFNAVPFFTQKGFDTFRFNFYTRATKARQLSECSITTHAEDLNNVIKRFKDEYEEIILIGHSIGCHAIIKTDTSDVKQIILWDPSSGMESLGQKYATYDESSGLYILHWGLEIFINQQMVDEWMELCDIEKVVKQIPEKTSFIFAGGYKIYDLWRDHLDAFDVEVIPGASHGFIEEGAMDELFENTLWKLS